MGMVFQAYSLFPTMTARQNIEFGLRLRGLSKAERSAEANEVLELVRPRLPCRPVCAPALGR